MERLNAFGDAATGTHVLQGLYDAIKDTPTSVDLGVLFANLGVSLAVSEVVIDDAAPLALIRTAILKPYRPGR